ncbi:cobalt transporter CbiM [Pelagibacterium limicola]|uniref:cobalt transporter CbiM n=1 Tax=Pelagibacterium limicola TaxID=2791022 RepID=UPI0018AF9D9E|nr:cobalt transporter CbiM [Pelagibacterium limicola]
MHIPDGILPVGLAISGWIATGGLVALSVKRIESRPDPRAGIPRAAMMTAVFFAASLIHIPVPPTSVHLMLSGLMGAMLGWYAIPAIAIGLFLQAVMFGHGGLTTLGVNGIILGLPALAAFALPRQANRTGSALVQSAAGFAAGAGAILFAVALFTTILLAGLPAHLDADAERVAILTLAVAHLPLALAEGLVVAAVLGFLRRVSPELAHAS